MAELLPVRVLSQVERDFAAWLVRSVGQRYTRAAQRAMLSRLLGHEVTEQDVLALRTDPEFRDYLKECKRSAETSVARAKQLAHEMYPEAMRIHRRALKRADEKHDYKAVPALTEPVWKRVLPIRDEEAKPTQVTITLTTQRLADLAKPPIDVEVEELAIPQEPTGESV
jgi:hypothetical protein